MKERPILMSAPMVRAILAGTKTQTRRVVKQATGPSLSVGYDDKTGLAELSWLYGDGPGHEVHEATKHVACPYGQPGDRLRVKEAAWMWCERRPNGKTKTGRDKWVYVPMSEAPIHYAADHPKKPAIDVVSPDTGNTWGWRLKIGRFLPRWASRITLEITEVRVERLQDISDEDSLAEGIYPTSTGLYPGSPRAAYQKLWEQINGPGSWEANPWVWCVEFKRVESA